VHEKNIGKLSLVVIQIENAGNLAARVKTCARQSAAVFGHELRNPIARLTVEEASRSKNFTLPATSKAALTGA
jgi:hypothetical protein